MEFFMLRNLPRAILVSLILLVLGVYGANAQTDWIQAQGYGIASNDNAYWIDVDSDGNSYVVGTFRGQVDFGNGNVLNSAGSSDVFVAKVDIEGVCQWAVSAGGNNSENGNSISIDANGNVYITGTFNGSADFDENTTLNSAGSDDIFVAKYNNNGTLQWAVSAGGSSVDYSNAIKVDGNGNVYITGSIYTEADFGAINLTTTGYEELFIAQLDASNGGYNWAKNYSVDGMFENSAGFNIEVSSDNNTLYVTGNYSGTLNFDENTSIVADGFSDIYLATFDNAGNVQWAATAGSGVDGFNSAYGLALDGNGNIYISGSFNETLEFDANTSVQSYGFDDAFLAKYDNTGSPLWAQSAGSTANFDNSSSVTVNQATGDVYISGNFEEKATFDPTALAPVDIFAEGGVDLFLAKYASDGSFEWAKAAGGTGDDYGTYIQFGAQDIIYLAGSSSDDFSFNEQVDVTNNGNDDILLAKYGAILPAPLLNSPADQATDVNNTNLELQWASVTDADSYTLQVSSDNTFQSNFTVNLNNLTSTTFSILELDFGTTYYVRLRSINEVQTGPWSQTYEFTTVEILPPVLDSPANSSINVSRTATLSWSDAQFAEDYTLEIAEDVSFTSPILTENNIEDSEFKIPEGTLNLNTEYFWRVRTNNSIGNSEFSSAFSFFTIPLEVPTPISPADMATRVPLVVTIEWGSSESATSYDLQIATDSEFNNLIIDETGLSTTFNIGQGTFNYETDYYWQVRAKNASFTSPWSASRMFTTTPESIIQDVNIEQGWNRISLYVDPLDPGMADVFSGIASDIVIVRDGSNAFIPSFNFNTIGDWKYVKGYRVYARNSATLSVEGVELVPEDENITLSTGWNETAYLRQSPLSAPDALTNLSNLVICKDNDNGVYIPSFNFNSIGNLEPGKGYRMYVSQTDIFNYPANSGGKFAANFNSPLEPTQLIPNMSRTGNTATLILKTNLATGTEIGAWNSNDELVGSGVVQETGLAVIAVYGDNEETNNIDGSLDNEELTLKALNINTNSISDLEITSVTDLINGSKFDELSYSKDAYLNIDVNSNIDNSKLSVSPNPTSNRALLEYTLENKSLVNVNLIDISGREILSIINNDLQTKGTYFEEIDLQNLANGTYYINLNINGEIKTLPLNVTK